MARAKTPQDGEDGAGPAEDTSAEAITRALDDIPEEAETVDVAGPRVFDAPSPSPSPSPSPPPPPVPPEPAARPAAERAGGVGMLPLLIGGVLAAGAGFLVSRAVPEGWPTASVAPFEARVAAQEAEVARLTAEVAARPETDLSPLAEGIGTLRDQVAGLEAAVAEIPPAPPLPPDPGPRLDALEGRLAALEARADPTEALNALEARVAAVEALPAAAVSGDPAAAAQLAQDLAAVRAEIAAARAAAPAEAAPAEVAALKAEIAALREDLAQDRAAAEGATGDISAQVEAARAALAEAEAQAGQLRDATAAAVAAARRDAALGRISAAVDSGAPFAGAVAELSAAGTTVPPALLAVAETGVPTLLSVQAAFPEAARAALAASLRADMGDTTMERFGTFLRAQTGVRSLEPREGNDPDAVLSRAASAVAGGDMADALAEIAALPEAGQAELAGWAESARRRVDAAAAIAALAAAP